MNAVSTSPIPREVIERFINETMEKHYIQNGVDYVYPDQNDDFTGVFQNAWESDSANRFDKDALAELFYSDYVEEWYSDYQNDVLGAVHNTLREKLESYAEDQNLSLSEVEKQIEEENDNIDENIAFNYDSVINQMSSEVAGWLSNRINEKITSIELGNAVASKMTLQEADYLSEIKPISEFKAWFMTEYGVDGDNYSDNIDSIVQVLDDARHTEIRDAHEDEDDSYEQDMAKASLELVENASVEELIEKYDEFGFNEVVYRVNDLVLMEV